VYHNDHLCGAGFPCSYLPCNDWSGSSDQESVVEIVLILKLYVTLEPSDLKWIVVKLRGISTAENPNPKSYKCILEFCAKLT
jgi:hypothetical protein